MMNQNNLQTTGLISIAVLVVGVAVSTTPVSAMVEDAQKPVQITETAPVTTTTSQKSVAAKEDKAAALQDKKDARDTAKTQKACERLGASSDKLQARLTVRNEKLQGWQETQTEKVAERKELRKGQLIETRAKTDARRTQHYADLVALADTTEKKAALATYGDAVDAAVKVRRAVIDENLALFWTHSKDIILEEKKAYAQQYSLYAQSVDAAIVEAETACATNGADVKAISKELRTQLKAGQDASQTANKETKDARGKIGEELQARRQAINEATKEFKEQVRVARKDLVKVFGSEVFGDLDENEDEQ